MLTWLKNLMRPAELISAEQQQWLEQGMAQFNRVMALHQFSPRLITPTIKDFPSKADSPEGIALATLQQIKQYMGLEQQSFTIKAPNQFDVSLPAHLLQPMVLNQKQNALSQPVYIDYHPAHLNNPNALVSVMAIQLSHWLLQPSELDAIGGEQMRPQAAELLSIALGAGIMVANSAFTFRGGGCGSCHNTKLGRQAMLSEAETCYAIALFCQSHDLDYKKALPHLKPHLRSMVKMANKQLTKKAATHFKAITQ
ncbi:MULTISPECIES: hypothetical protein [unclassified Motilimonas]|uniref:hypothetical protein n=1 Tax=unclassified Motilimonas TaxID=2643697 RepID=UPI001E47EC54|nr:MULTISPECIES: hypothetical protein [unclassified Motilimonas]MCE0558454.1 hypothetical protein [Motilimonas sp. E26]MDO6526574.1 hypothetical protein [Motilimonas sp. 1_MG-2023]